MIVHYTLSILLLIFTALSSLRLSAWWVKMWDAGRMQLAFFLGVLLIIGFIYFDYYQTLQYVLLFLLSSAIVYHLWIIFPFTPLHRVEVKRTDNRNLTLRMLTCNVRMSNRKTDKTLDLIQQKNPDLVLLTEVDFWWLDQLLVLEKEYPHTVLQGQDNTYGIALYSKFPLEDAQVKFLVEKDIPSIHAIIKLKEERIQFIGLHPRPPAPWTKEENKDIELIKVASSTNYNLLPSIITGDLNDVGWSKITKAFKVISGLKDPRIGRGLFNTYNANIPFFRYPVDHFFVSKQFKLREIKRLPHVGSDHFPVLLEVNLEG
ncbi:MAG: endonuclease/exonuclease/phosphatase family protein [Bacteroidota bacterium]